MIDDETLTLYFYGDELDRRERDRIEAALASDAALAKRYAELSQSLDALQGFAPRAAPPASVIGWRYALDSAIAADARPERSATWAWAIGAAAVLILGIGIGIGLSSVGPGPSQPTAAVVVPPDARSTPRAHMPPLALTRGLTAHLRETRLQLVGLEDAGDDARIELINHVIEQNRLLESAAVASGAPDLARVLRAFEKTLEELARAQAPPQHIAETTSQLSFEYAVVLTKLNQAASHIATSL